MTLSLNNLLWHIAAVSCWLWALAASAAAADAIELEQPASAVPVTLVHVDTAAPSVAAGPVAEDAAQEAPAEFPLLTPEEALRRALAAHPRLAWLEKEYLARDSEAWQAGRLLNPELELELDNFLGTADAVWLREMTTSLTYSQQFERGGKRHKRETAVSLERDLVLWDIEELKYSLRAQVRVAYGKVQNAQQTLAALHAYHELLDQIRDTVSLQVDAGRSASLELERLELELAKLKLEQSSAQRTLDLARQQLAGLWGGELADFAVVATGAPAASGVPTLDKLMPALELLPVLARLEAEYLALCAQVDLEHANSVPDTTVFGGLTRVNGADETVFKVGVALDIPLHDRNEGSISAANQRLAQVADRRAALRRELIAQLAALQLSASNAWQTYSAYETELLPVARDVLYLMEEGFRYGKFALLDVLDAQRTVQQLQREQSAAASELHAALAEIEALLGVSLQELPGLHTSEQHAVVDTPSETAAAGEFTEKEHE